jgi:type II secretory pathway component PulL
MWSRTRKPEANRRQSSSAATSYIPAQQRVYELRAQPLQQMHDWLERYRKVWDIRFEALDHLLVQMQGPEARRTAKLEMPEKRDRHKEFPHERKQDRNHRR